MAWHTCGTPGWEWRPSWRSLWRICESRWGRGGPSRGRRRGSGRPAAAGWATRGSPRSQASPGGGTVAIGWWGVVTATETSALETWPGTIWTPSWRQTPKFIAGSRLAFLLSPSGMGGKLCLLNNKIPTKIETLIHFCCSFFPKIIFFTTLPIDGGRRCCDDAVIHAAASLVLAGLLAPQRDDLLLVRDEHHGRLQRKDYVNDEECEKWLMSRGGHNIRCRALGTWIT